LPTDNVIFGKIEESAKRLHQTEKDRDVMSVLEKVGKMLEGKDL